MGNSSKQKKRRFIIMLIYLSSKYACSKNLFINRSNNNKCCVLLLTWILLVYESLLFYDIRMFYNDINIFPFKTEILLTCNSLQWLMFSIVDRNFVDSWDSTVLGELLCSCSDGEHNYQIRHPLWKSCPYICMADYAVLNLYYRILGL